MPRKSVAALTTVTPTVNGKPTRLLPGDDLPDDVASAFRQLVNAAEAGFYCELDRAAVTSFAHCAARELRAEAHLALEGDVLESNKPNPWLKVAADARFQMVTMWPRLRSCPSARLQAKQARPDPAAPDLARAMQLVREGRHD